MEEVLGFGASKELIFYIGKMGLPLNLPMV